MCDVLLAVLECWARRGAAAGAGVVVRPLLLLGGRHRLPGGLIDI